MSGLVLAPRQTRRVASNAIAEGGRGTCRELSDDPSFVLQPRPKMIAMHLRPLWWLLSYLAVVLRDIRPGAHALVPLFSNTSFLRVSILSPVCQKPVSPGQAPQQRRRLGMVAVSDLPVPILSERRTIASRGA